MYPGNLGNSSHESSLQRSWYDSNSIPFLNSSNVLAYFTEKSNPFYEKQCNNEIMRMQGFSPEKLLEMTGIEYVLLHAQEPILYVIRQQQRHSPTQVTPIAEYYIIAGIVYQAPDLNSVISSRLANAINSLGSAFTEAQSYSRYHPSKGYWWEFKDQGNHVEKNKAKEKPLQENIGSVFQRERVDALLFDFDQRFGIRKPVLPEKTEETVKTEKQEKEAPTNQNSSSDRPTAGVTVKQEKKMKPLR